MPQITASMARRSSVRAVSWSAVSSVGCSRIAVAGMTSPQSRRQSLGIRATLLPWLGRWRRPDQRFELIGDGEEERPPLRAISRSELRLDAQTVHHAGLRDDHVAFQTDSEDAVLASLEERRSLARLVARHLELAVVDESQVRDECGHRLAARHLELEERFAKAALDGENVANLQVCVLLVRVDLVCSERRERPVVLGVEVKRGARLKEVRPHP